MKYAMLAAALLLTYVAVFVVYCDRHAAWYWISFMSIIGYTGLWLIWGITFASFMEASKRA